MRTATDIETAWAAGIFEGEGSIEISAKNARHTRHVRLRVGMCDQDVVEKFAAVAGCGSVIERGTAPSVQDHWKPQWLWRASQLDECKLLLESWLPHFGSRRAARAQEALELINGKAYDRYRTCYCGKHYEAERCNNREFCSVKCRTNWKTFRQNELAA